MMTERRVTPGLAMLSAMILAFPGPAAQAKTLNVANCNGGMTRIDLPINPMQQDEHECCRKGCHAANDRRKKSDRSLLADCC
jgi:hypothetical protein